MRFAPLRHDDTFAMLGELFDTGVFGRLPPGLPLGNDDAAVPPSSAMNARRRDLLNCICGSYASDSSKLQNIKLIGMSQQIRQGF